MVIILDADVTSFEHGTEAEPLLHYFAINQSIRKLDRITGSMEVSVHHWQHGGKRASLAAWR